MPNTTQENQYVRSALRIMLKKYDGWLPGLGFFQDFRSAVIMNQNIENFVEFQDLEPFNREMGLKGLKVNPGCMTTGYCDVYPDNRRKVFINRMGGQNSPTTVLHELFHFHTSQAFSEVVPLSIDEGVTEYFTRKALKHSGEMEHFSFSDRHYHYDMNHTALGFKRDEIKQGTPKTTREDYMKKAYFRGSRFEINFIMQNMAELVDLL